MTIMRKEWILSKIYICRHLGCGRSTVTCTPDPPQWPYMYTQADVALSERERAMQAVGLWYV